MLIIIQSPLPNPVLWILYFISLRSPYVFLCLTKYYCSGSSQWDFIRNLRNETFQPHVDTCRGKKNSLSTDELCLVIFSLYTLQSSLMHALFIFSLSSAQPCYIRYYGFYSHPCHCTHRPSVSSANL